MSSQVAEIHGLNLSLQGKPVLHNVNMVVRPAQITALIGENGAGKTSMIRCITGLYPPTQGICAVFGEQAYYMSQGSRNRLGVVFDEGGLYGEMSAWENVLFFARLRGIPRARIEEPYNRLVQQFELKTSLKVGHFSKGMKQKLRIIRELLHKPELLILDEPFNGLDPDSKFFLRDQLSAICSDQGTSILISSHDLFDLEKIADQVVMIHRGRIVADQSIQTITEVTERYIVICSNPQHAVKILHNVKGIYVMNQDEQSVSFMSGSGSVKHLLQLLLQHGIEVEEFFKEKNSLEDFYKKIKQATIRE
ncbi:ABC transporter ATP-binding protein [Paenibacillus xylanexedens]|uniref:ABC transporter ATP-binding protein n=1 Tax=Paenibacillus xylanexedens TaxID=528191 RepID=UPI00119CCBD9|nr:ABC transporter ATP-binding protein [Paenibacillus xylanexedens]